MDQLSIVPGLPGLFVACVFSASLSTLSSGFNAMATVTFDDFLNKFDCIKSLNERTIQRMSKIIAFSYGIATIGMAFLAGRLDSVLQVKNCFFNIYNNFFINFFLSPKQAAISIAGALIGPMLGLFLQGILFPFANSFV